MFSTTYPKIAARGIPMQSGSDSSWLLPHVCMHSLHTIGIPILLLYSEIFLMHQPQHNVFLDVLIIYAGAFDKFGDDTTRNMIDVRTAAL
jgi:hypothetical protein